MTKLELGHTLNKVTDFSICLDGINIIKACEEMVKFQNPTFDLIKTV
jgi:hypothetical protein